MFKVGHLYRFEPFYFKSRNEKTYSPKNKYYIVLAINGEDIILGSLPTSKDHIPEQYQINQGSLDIPQSNVNVYKIAANTQVTECFSFERDTFIYGEQLNTYSLKELSNNNPNIIDLGLIFDNIFNDIIKNLRNSKMVKNKYKKMLII